ncbi:hypothetical protein RS030_193020 [Cryptosporidium xiaoi]|uniref:Uncharacterized protein n=1 Tax=Cryptosporidium xiaoi TaxID=659607 RepID=A0AAV9XZS2_9CRYT
MFEKGKLCDALGLFKNEKPGDVVNNFTISEYYKSNKSSDSELSKENSGHTSNKNSKISDERSLSCITPIYPEIQKKSTVQYNHCLRKDNPNNIWDSLLILKKKVVRIFWSIVSLDKDEPLYDFSTPIGDVNYFGSSSNNISKVDAHSLLNGSFLIEPLKVGVVSP